MKRNPDGYGGISKLNGNRRKPYMAYKNVPYLKGNLIPQELKTRSNRILEPCSDISDTEIVLETSTLLYEMRKALGDDTSIAEWCRSLVADYISENDVKGGYRKVKIGYYETKADAMIALADANKSNLDYTTNPTFAEVWSAIDVSDKSASTQKSYTTAYAHCETLYDKSVRDITLKDLQAVIDNLEGLSDSSQNNVIIVFHKIFEYAYAHELVARDISKSVKKSKTAERKSKTIFTDLEIQKLKSNGYDDIVFLIYTGLRVSEYLGLNDEDFEEGYIRVHGTKNKTSDRIVPIHPSIESLTLRWQHLNYSKFSRRFHDAMEELGMNHTIHETRHTFATISKKYRLEPTLRQYILGHSNGNITDDVYTHPESLIPELCEEMKKIVC